MISLFESITSIWYSRNIIGQINSFWSTRKTVKIVCANIVYEMGFLVDNLLRYDSNLQYQKQSIY